MKNIIFTAAMMFTAAIWAQQPADYALVAGVIKNKTQDFKITSRDQSYSKNLKIAADGSFKDTIKGAEGPYFIYDGKSFASLYIQKGSSMIISADAQDLNATITFSGKGSEISTYMLTKIQTKNKAAAETAVSIYALEQTAFKDKASQIKNSLAAVLESSAGLSDAFKAREKRNIQYGYLGELAKYEKYHEYFAKKPGFKVSENFLAEMSTVSFSNAEDYKYCDDYKALVVFHYSEKAQAAAKKEGIAEDLALLREYAQIPEESIREDLLFAAAQTGITFTDDLKAYYKIFMDGSANEEHKKTITASYNELLKVGRGLPSPKFTNYENYSGGTSSLDDFKGKFVYIDIWATWCGPCKAEIPSLQKIETAYHGKNIAFVSISVDKAKSHDKWKEMIAKEKMGGIQLFADKDFDSQFIKDYLIRGIPRFILIDPQGKIVSASAPRPSDEAALVQLLTQLGI